MDSVMGRSWATASKRTLFIALALLLAVTLVLAMILTPTLGTTELDASGETAQVVAGASWSWGNPGGSSNWSIGGHGPSWG